MSAMDLHGLVKAQLATIPEPCSLAMRCPTDIVSMGLIEDIAIEDGHVCVTLCLTDPACVHFRGMQAYIRDALSAFDWVKSVKVVQTLETLWTPDRVQS